MKIRIVIELDIVPGNPNELPPEAVSQERMRQETILGALAAPVSKLLSEDIPAHLIPLDFRLESAGVMPVVLLDDDAPALPTLEAGYPECPCGALLVHPGRDNCKDSRHPSEEEFVAERIVMCPACGEPHISMVEGSAECTACGWGQAE